MDELFLEIHYKSDGYIISEKGDILPFIDKLQECLSSNVMITDIDFPLSELRCYVRQLQVTKDVKYHRLSLDRLDTLKANAIKSGYYQ
ncbi:hypothetical protein [Shewanella surugensis]|uniref:Uncharacterized protein n=1 Tax=Shewanella surugensis TaxID=212020 RepID=A0ABT0LIX7_9GAMM|nr:hypothetical protein [Shewanella surugensis]MCL1127663.1 hypothetical protein [Shewanella surugensis]